MKSETKAKRSKLTLWSIFKWTTLLLVAVFVLVNAVFFINQDAYLMERRELPTGYEEKPELEPAFNRFVAPPGRILPNNKKDWPPVEVAINFQKFESFAQSANGPHHSWNRR